jgi:hypothetical protein
MRQTIVPAVVLAAVLPGAAQEPSPRLPAPPACAVSADPEFARTTGKAARVGGGAYYVGGRERRYLEALRGPEGQALTFERKGSTRQSPDGGILDHWQVSWAGLGEPISIYLDAYHYADPVAPAGFTCVGFKLGPPPIDVFLASTMQVRLAIERGPARELDPIPLGADLASPSAVVFDRFRLVAAAARAAAAAGAPIDPDDVPREVELTPAVVVALPVACGDRAVAPSAIEVLSRGGQPVKRRGEPVSGAELAALVPGYAAPEGAAGVAIDLPALRPTDTVRVTYAAELCDRASREATLPAPAMTPARPLDLQRPPFPEGVERTDEPVWLQVVVDVDGAFQQPRYIGGPEALREAAMAAIHAWRATPARMNGVPVVTDTLLLVRFR